MQKILYIFTIVLLLSSCGATNNESSQEKPSSISQEVGEVVVFSWAEENVKVQVIDSDDIPTEESIVSNSGMTHESPILPVASDDMDSTDVTIGD